MSMGMYLTCMPRDNDTIRVDATVDYDAVRICVGEGTQAVVIHLSWDQLDMLIFAAGVQARDHDERLQRKMVDLGASPAQHIDAINE